MQKPTLLTLLLGAVVVVNMVVPPVETGDSSRRSATKFRVYVHDILGGENQTVWEVAKSNVSDILPSMFGTVYVLDNLVTSGPEIDSAEVGRLQGMAALSDLQEVALDMLLNLVFTQREYEGSVLSIFGRNALYRDKREVAIVGGAGAFRMASGYVVITTYTRDEAGTRDVYQYDFFVHRLDHHIIN